MDDSGRARRRRILEPARQAVLDAAAVLQARRTEMATALAGGRRVEAEIVQVRRHHTGVALIEGQDGWSELLSVRPSASAAQLRATLPNTRALLDAGLRMTSVYDADGLDAEARLMLAGETSGTYLLSTAPVQMKIVNRRHVLLQGPGMDGFGTVMAVRSEPCLQAAWRYWEAVQATAFPVTEAMGPLAELTPRQRQVVALLATGVGDDAIATALGVSVRTVRTDIARVLDALGARSRFAAGMRLQALGLAGSCNEDDAD